MTKTQETTEPEKQLTNGKWAITLQPTDVLIVEAAYYRVDQDGRFFEFKDAAHKVTCQVNRDNVVVIQRL